MKFIETLQGHPAFPPPIWVMRQAGRYLPEYQALRKQAGSFFALCDSPKYASEVTLQPLHRFNLDAAIIFSDILVIPRALGRQVDFIESKGPQVDKLTNPEQVTALVTSPQAILQSVQPTLDAISLTRTQLPADKALIGFCGAPWTLALYMLDANPSKGGHIARQWAYHHPKAFKSLLDKITQVSITYLSAQIEAGANALQIFDSWAGQAPDSLYKEVVQTPILTICQALKEKHPQTPIIIFARGLQERRLKDLAEAGATANLFNGLGLDESISPNWAIQNLPQNLCLQGNLDPAILLTNPETIRTEAQKIRDAFKTHKGGYIFNLGHGILPQTPPEHMAALVDALQESQ